VAESQSWECRLDRGGSPDIGIGANQTGVSGGSFSCLKGLIGMTGRYRIQVDQISTSCGTQLNGEL